MFLHCFLSPYMGQHIANQQYFRRRTVTGQGLLDTAYTAARVTRYVHSWVPACSLSEVHAKKLWKIVFLCRMLHIQKH
jgi:hypothetical protein